MKKKISSRSAKPPLESMPGPIFSYKLRYIVGFWLVEMAISTNQKPTIYRKLYENTGPDSKLQARTSLYLLETWYSLTCCHHIKYSQYIYSTRHKMYKDEYSHTLWVWYVYRYHPISPSSCSLNCNVFGSYVMCYTWSCEKTRHYSWQIKKVFA